MKDMINWKFLAQELDKIAKLEPLSPADRTYLEQQPIMPKDLEQQAHPQIKTEETTYTSPSIRQPGSDSGNYIEVTNVKGKIVKINPDEYEVTILSSTDDVIVRNNINKIASGIYVGILQNHGAEKTLECIIKDFIRSPVIFNDRSNCCHELLDSNKK